MPASPIQVWDPIPKPHRRIARAGDKPRRGADIKRFKRAVNHFIDTHPHLELGPKLHVDGRGGAHCIKLGRRVCRLAGFAPGGNKPYGISVYAQQRLIGMAEGHDVRTQGERDRARLAQDARRKAVKAAEAPKVKGNTVTGGTFPQRKAKAMTQAMWNYEHGVKRRFYSQSGRFVLGKAIVGEDPGERSDCSLFEVSLQICCGRTNNLTGYFTGTAIVEGIPCRREDLIVGLGYAVYGTGNGHHMEAYYGDGVGGHTYAEVLRLHGREIADQTCGHGDSAVNLGDLDMMASARYFNLPKELQA